MRRQGEEWDLIRRVDRAHTAVGKFIMRHYPKSKAAKPEQQARLKELQQELYDAWDALNDFRQRQHDDAGV